MGDQRILSIDPGEVHCGTALWLGGKCVSVKEYAPGALFAYLEDMLRSQSLDLVVMEEFRLYPWKAVEQGFSQLKTVETIGVVRYLVARWGMTIPLIEQPALIKKPTEGHMRAGGVKHRAVVEKAGGHCKDAESHGYWYLHYGGKKP